MSMWTAQEIQIARSIVQAVRSRSIPSTVRTIQKELKKYGIEKKQREILGFLVKNLK